MARANTGGRATRRQYTDEAKEVVVADARAIGVNAAARKHGVHQTNVSRWLKAAKLAEEQPSENDARYAATRPAATSKAPEAAPEQKGGAEAASAGATAKKKAVAKVYTPSQKAEILEYAATHGVSAAAEKFNTSRFSVYDWQRKVRLAAAGQGKSPTSGPAPQDIETQRDKEILGEWHKNPGLGPSQIKNQLRRRNIKVSVHTTRRVMEDAGYRPPVVERKAHDERFEAARPNQMWHLDFVQRHINRASTYTLILLDDCSRFATGHGVDDAERADLVIKTFEESVSRHGRPESVLHDKGAAFWSWRGISRFTALLTEMGIDQIVAEHKEWNGKLEVFNANIQKELFDVHRFYDVAEMRRRLASYLAWYNHQRTHHALGGLLVPADRYFGRVEDVLARIEAGAGRELGDGLDLRQRTLDFFRVMTHNGVPEVWLMGKKILDLGES
jgi:transposase InsO family protein